MDLIEVKTAGVFVVDMMYASDANMMQTDVYGKVGLGNRCFVHPDVWTRLQKLEPVLQSKGLKLKICDLSPAAGFPYHERNYSDGRIFCRGTGKVAALPCFGHRRDAA